MFQKLKQFFKKEETTKTQSILITIHGFGIQRMHEMDDFVKFAGEHLMEVKTFNLFDFENENDDNYKKWITVAEDVVLEALKESKKVYLLGFSMGGVIAAHLAKKYPIEKLILISPAFIHFNLENYTNIAIKTGKKIFSGTEETKPSIPINFYSSFTSLIKEYKNDIKGVSCPVLILQGDEDEVISTRSSEWAYEQIPHNKKQCIFLHKGKHRVLQDKTVKETAFVLIQDYLEDRFITKG